MRKSTSFVAVLIAALFLLVCAAIALPGTLASVFDGPAEYTELVIEPGGGKVVPPGWCIEHGYLRLRYPDSPYVCPHCD